LKATIFGPALTVSIGNAAEEKLLLIQTLKLQKGQNNDLDARRTLGFLVDANERLGHFAGAAANEGSAEKFRTTRSEQATTLFRLSWLPCDNK